MSILLQYFSKRTTIKHQRKNQVWPSRETGKRAKCVDYSWYCHGLLEWIAAERQPLFLMYVHTNRF